MTEEQKKAVLEIIECIVNDARHALEFQYGELDYRESWDDNEDDQHVWVEFTLTPFELQAFEMIKEELT